METLPLPAALASLALCAGLLWSLRGFFARKASPEAPPLKRALPDLLLPLLGFFIGTVLVAGAYALMKGAGEESPPPLTLFALTAAVQAAVVGIVIFVARERGATWAHFGVHGREAGRGIQLGFLMYLVVLPGIAGAGSLWGPLVERWQEKEAVQEVALQLQAIQGAERVPAFLLAAVLIPVLEEILFRGYFQNWAGALLGRRQGLLWTSVIFAFLHGLEPLAPLLVIAFGAGLLMHWSRNLWACMTLHVLNNSMATLVLFLAPETLP
ncbi:MAG: type II CAAX endopeptidase family protein [Planctomycetota bacterium]